MQRDFVDSGGFGELLGNDVSPLRGLIGPIQKLLAAWREQGPFVIHTREGHRPDLADCPPSKLARGHLEIGIGDKGPLGRVLVRGEWGHDIVDELRPLPSEPIIDKPGKGSFHATDLHSILEHRKIRSLVVAGVTTEVCVQRPCARPMTVASSAWCWPTVGSYFPEFHVMGLTMIAAQGGIFPAGSRCRSGCWRRWTRGENVTNVIRNASPKVSLRERSPRHHIRIQPARTCAVTKRVFAPSPSEHAPPPIIHIQ